MSNVDTSQNPAVNDPSSMSFKEKLAFFSRNISIKPNEGANISPRELSATMPAKRLLERSASFSNIKSVYGAGDYKQQDFSTLFGYSVGNKGINGRKRASSVDSGNRESVQSTKPSGEVNGEGIKLDGVEEQNNVGEKLESVKQESGEVSTDSVESAVSTSGTTPENESVELSRDEKLFLEGWNSRSKGDKLAKFRDVHGGRSKGVKSLVARLFNSEKVRENSKKYREMVGGLIEKYGIFSIPPKIWDKLAKERSSEVTHGTLERAEKEIKEYMASQGYEWNEREGCWIMKDPTKLKGVVEAEMTAESGFFIKTKSNEVGAYLQSGLSFDREGNPIKLVFGGVDYYQRPFFTFGEELMVKLYPSGERRIECTWSEVGLKSWKSANRGKGSVRCQERHDEGEKSVWRTSNYQHNPEKNMVISVPLPGAADSLNTSTDDSAMGKASKNFGMKTKSQVSSDKKGSTDAKVGDAGTPTSSTTTSNEKNVQSAVSTSSKLPKKGEKCGIYTYQGKGKWSFELLRSLEEVSEAHPYHMEKVSCISRDCVIYPSVFNVEVNSKEGKKLESIVLDNYLFDNQNDIRNAESVSASDMLGMIIGKTRFKLVGKGVKAKGSVDKDGNVMLEIKLNENMVNDLSMKLGQDFMKNYKLKEGKTIFVPLGSKIEMDGFGRPKGKEENPLLDDHSNASMPWQLYLA